MKISNIVTKLETAFLGPESTAPVVEKETQSTVSVNIYKEFQEPLMEFDI